MSHSEFGLGALAGASPVLLGLAWILTRSASRRGMAREAHRAAFEQAAESVLLVDPRTLEIVDANRSLLRGVSYTHREICRLPLAELLIDGSGDAGAFLHRLREPQAELPLTIRQRGKDGKLRPVEVRGHRLDLGNRHLLALTLNEVPAHGQTEVQFLEKQTHPDNVAHHDPLTGLPNRLFLAEQLPVALEQARNSGALLGVLFIDLDRFTHINDSRGHAMGDQLLNTVAARLRTSVQAQDMVVRMEGDAFVVILKSPQSTQEITEVAARINETLASPMTIGGRRLMITGSIGISLYPGDGADAHALLRNASTAMFQAKQRGRNHVQRFSRAMGRRQRKRIAIESGLRSALQARELEVHYQPIVNIKSQHVVALESLLRWRRPARGFVPPKRFIPIAEESGLIVPLGELVLERTIEDIARWQEAGCATVPVAVNISALQLQRCDLAETILRMTKQRGVDPRMLHVELTESAVFERSGESSEDAVTRLQALGVRVAIDDFGTGYSSLAYLKRWRVDRLKIDRSFVRDLVTNPSDLAIVDAIIAMAQHLGIEVVAEGVEAWQQLQKLRQLGCSLVQGYLFAKPAPAEQCRCYLSGAPLQLTASGATPDGLGTAGDLHPAH